MSHHAPTDVDIQRIVDLVVAEVIPLRVVLFGSRARGDYRPDSDIDLMVVMPDGADRRQVMGDLHVLMGRCGVPYPVEFLVTTPAAIEQVKDRTDLVYYDVVREGRELYAA